MIVGRRALIWLRLATAKTLGLMYVWIPQQARLRMIVRCHAINAVRINFAYIRYIIRNYRNIFIMFYHLLSDNSLFMKENCLNVKNNARF